MIKSITIVILCFVLSSISGQDLRTAWGDYAAIDIELNKALERERFLVEKQNDLREEMRSLEKNKSWYNGWINEMLLARRSAEQVELADSLQTVQRRIADLSNRRDEAFLTLKRTYELILLEKEESDSLSLADKQRAILMGRWIMNRNLQAVDLPDYTSILTSNYEDENIKQLVLEDLSSVLEVKLSLIDSLITERQLERELIDRLDEFHRDLSLQLESDRDPASAGSQTFAESPGGADLDLDVGALTGEYGTYITDDRERELKSNIDVTILQTEITQERAADFRFGVNSVEDDITHLRFKRQQYQELLRQIEKELAQ